MPRPLTASRTAEFLSTSGRPASTAALPAHEAVPLSQLRDVCDNREPVLLGLPGSGLSPCIFGALALTVRVVPVDWASGAGAADPPAVALRLARAIAGRSAPTLLAGQSTGCAIALLTALRAPSAVQGLVLSNSGVHSRAHGDPALPERIRTSWTAGAQREFLRSCTAAPLAPPLFDVLVDYLAALPAARLLAAVLGTRRLDFTDALQRITCPALIAHGRDDHRRRVVDAEALAAGLPDASLVLLPGGHTPMAEHPDAYREAVQSFVDTIIERQARDADTGMKTKEKRGTP